jgi:glutathione peroxidase
MNHSLFQKISIVAFVSFISVAATAASIYEIPLKTIDGKDTTLKEYKGKTLLIVNTASECGYTSQYKGLQQTYLKYKDKGLVVLGFPSNDFGGQEPGSNKEIKKFCELKFKTTFPMFEKNPVKGSNKQPLYQFLISNSKEKGEIGWNFEKFLVDRTGRIAGRFKSSVEPDSHVLLDAIELELK